MKLEQHWQHLKTMPVDQRVAYLEAFIHPKLFNNLEPMLAPAPQISVHTLGTSIEPVVIAARKIGAGNVVLLGTKETIGSAERIGSHLHNQAWQALEVERSGTRSIYDAARAAIANLTSVALEVTSGTKAMVAALSMLAVTLRLEGRKVKVYYVDNPKWDSEMRRPEPGHEQLLELELP